MSDKSVSRVGAGRRPWSLLAPWGAAAVLLVVLTLHLTLDLPGHIRPVGASPTPPPAAATAAAPAAPPDSISLDAARQKIAGVELDEARTDELASELGVPGLVEVDADRRAEIRSRAPSIVREVHVTLGQKIKKGDPMVTLDSPDVATARLNLRARQRELITARIEADWRTKVADTVSRLIPEIVKGADPEDLENEFANQPLGTFRALLLQAYTDFDIATHEEEKTALLRGKEVIGEHPAVVAKHTRQGLQARLNSVIEQVRFDAGQQRRLADQALKLAESAVVDAGQRLRVLGVDEDVQSLLAYADEAQDPRADEDVTAYPIEAPFDGTVIIKWAVPSQRADPADLLFVLADMDDVWIAANIPESDLAKVPGIAGGPVRFTTTAYSDRVFDASLLFVGAILDPSTRTVPLLARCDNADGALRPGMFARILFDAPTSEKALTIPSSALLEIEGRPGVFQPRDADADGKRTFRFHRVEPGRAVGDRVVVKSGLAPGDLVVARGGFVLKSEMILQNQDDE